MFDNTCLDQYSHVILDVNAYLDGLCMDQFLKVLKSSSDFDILSVLCLTNPRFIRPVNCTQDIQIVGRNTFWISDSIRIGCVCINTQNKFNKSIDIVVSIHIFQSIFANITQRLSHGLFSSVLLGCGDLRPNLVVFLVF